MDHIDLTSGLFLDDLDVMMLQVLFKKIDEADIPISYKTWLLMERINQAFE